MEAEQYVKYFASDNKEEVPKEQKVRTNHQRNRKDIIVGELELDNCNSEQAQTIKRLVDRYPDQFYIQGDKLEKTDIIKHIITLKPGAIIVNQKQRRLPDSMKELMHKEIRDLEEMGVINESMSVYNSRAFFVPKKNDEGKKVGDRMVIDYRELNKQTEVEEFPIPLIDEILDDFSGCKYFTILDIKSAYYQIELTPECRHLTAFTAPYGKYEFNRVPMGLAGAPLTFQKAVNTIFRDLLGKGVNVYMDDVAISAKTQQEHDRLLQIVFERLENNRFKLRINKCRFYATEIHYLGFVISPKGISANPGKVRTIEDYPRPENQVEVQRFLGMMNYYRRFIKNFSHIAKPLTKLTPQLAEFIWTEQCEEAFNILKNELARNVTLVIPDFTQPFYITTDASAIAGGGILSQGTPPKDRPITFFSRTFSQTQQKYSTIQRELLAIMMALEAFRPYVYGRQFTIICDHEPLKFLFNLKNPNSRLHQYRLELADMDFKIIHRPGVSNKVADALSRIDWSKTETVKDLIEEHIETEEMKATCRAITRSKAKITAEDQPSKTNDKTHITYEPGQAREGRGFDMIFSMISQTTKGAFGKIPGHEKIDKYIHW